VLIFVSPRPSCIGVGVFIPKVQFRLDLLVVDGPFHLPAPGCAWPLEFTYGHLIAFLIQSASCVISRENGKRRVDILCQLSIAVVHNGAL